MPHFNWKTNTISHGKEIHLPGTSHDFTLCGLDTAGDSDIHVSDPEETTLKANCAQCIQTVEHCKNLSKMLYIH
jgi:hypothetical protein